ncbi:MAG: hypothetical protein ACREPG_08295 [Candidatus Binatia bacterium]
MKLLVGLMLVALVACSSDKGFRFEGRYEAAQSGYRIVVLSRGYVAAGFDIADNAFARVQICPIVAGAARPLRFSLAARPQTPRLFESEDVLTANANWSEKLLSAVLRTKGYAEPTAEELAGSFRVISNSLSGPKGVVLEGQIGSVKVLRANAEYVAADMKNRPAAEWVRVSELGNCDTVK